MLLSPSRIVTHLGFFALGIRILSEMNHLSALNSNDVFYFQNQLLVVRNSLPLAVGKLLLPRCLCKRINGINNLLLLYKI